MPPKAADNNPVGKKIPIKPTTTSNKTSWRDKQNQTGFDTKNTLARDCPTWANFAFSKISEHSDASTTTVSGADYKFIARQDQPFLRPAWIARQNKERRKAQEAPVLKTP